MNIKEKLKKYIDDNLIISFEKSMYDLDESCICNAKLKTYNKDDLQVSAREKNALGSTSLDNYIKQNKEDNKFQKTLFNFIKRQSSYLL